MNMITTLLKLIVTAMAKRIAIIGLLIECIDCTIRVLHVQTIRELMETTALTITGQAIDMHVSARQALLLELMRMQIVAIIRMAMIYTLIVFIPITNGIMSFTNITITAIACIIATSMMMHVVLILSAITKSVSSFIRSGQVWLLAPEPEGDNCDIHSYSLF